jgi:phenylalanyl-tRNA synthetase alpha chain
VSFLANDDFVDNWSPDIWMQRIQAAESMDELSKVRSAIFGKQGALTQELKALGGLSPEERNQRSSLLNVDKQTMIVAMAEHEKMLNDQAMQRRLHQEAIDVTMPSSHLFQGLAHPIEQTIHDVVDILAWMGCQVRRGPDIEREFFNFDALNVPPDHPARTMQDTFYMQPGYVLRTQTSPVQIHTLCEEKQGPLRIVSPGRVYRADHDRTHSPMFHQVECLVVEQGVHMGHLKSFLSTFLETFFQSTVNLRFRPSFFPFTTPSAEVDIAYHRKGGELIMGTGDEWMEILGCGMVHPHVFRSCGWPETSLGFAVGMGIERLAMLKYGIDDIRLFYLNDQRWRKPSLL